MRSLARLTSLVAPGAPKGGIVAAGIQRLLQRHGFHDVGIGTGVIVEGVDATGEALGILVDHEVEAKFAGHAISEGDHLAELPAGVDMQQRKGIGAGKKALRARCSMTEESLPIE